MTTLTAAERAAECLPCGCGYIPEPLLHKRACPALHRPAVAAAIERAVREERARYRPFLEMLQHDQWHGCTSGDCPHEHANKCVEDLVKVLQEHATDAEQFEIQDDAAAIRARGPA